MRSNEPAQRLHYRRESEAFDEDKPSLEGVATQIRNLFALRHGLLQHRVDIVIVFETFPRKRVSHRCMVGDIEMPLMRIRTHSSQ